MTDIFQYEVFRDILITVLTFSGIAIAVFGILGYQILKKRIEADVKKIADETYLKSIIRTMIEIGLMCWKNYNAEHHKEVRESLLQHAIEFTNDAYNRYAVNLDDKKRENDKIICLLKNNLAYYWAEWCHIGMGTETARSLAIDYANEIYQKKSKFPDKAESFVDTYNFVHEIFNMEICLKESDKKKKKNE